MQANRLWPLRAIAVLVFCGWAFKVDHARADESLRDSCQPYFENVRRAEAGLRAVESQQVRMVRLGGNPDIALYERLYKVHQAKVASAKAVVRQQESALSGCLANALRDSKRSVAGQGSGAGASNGARMRNAVLPEQLPIAREVEVRSPASSSAVPVQPQPVYSPPARGGATVR